MFCYLFTIIINTNKHNGNQERRNKQKKERASLAMRCDG